jgi:ubiquinone/menaquinone biosynthesis C-methylase UbiE
MSAPSPVPPAPAVLRLVQELVFGRWRATGEELYREVASLLEVGAGGEILVAGCGDGTSAEWLAARTGATVHGVDPDREAIAAATDRSRARPDPLPLVFEQGALDDLPHEDGVFDAAVGEPILAAAADPARAVAELARVTKPMGPVVLLQLTWSSDISAEGRRLLVERLGIRPHLLVEWKQMLRDAGVVDLQVQDWTEEGAEAASAPAEAPQLTWQQKMQVVGRALRMHGWRDALGAVEREEALLRELSRDRALGFQLIRGVKWPHARGD